AELDVPPDVLHALGARIAESRVVEALNGVVHVEAVLGAGRRLDGPVNELEALRLRDGGREQRLPRAGLSLHEERALESEGRIHCGFERGIGEIAVGTFEDFCLRHVNSERRRSMNGRPAPVETGRLGRVSASRSNGPRGAEKTPRRHAYVTLRATRTMLSGG